MFSSKLPSFLKIPQHRRFSYKARYYDVAKEQSRLYSMVKGGEVAKQKVQERFNQMRDLRAFARQRKQFNNRLLVILAVLVLVFYLLSRL